MIRQTAIQPLHNNDAYQEIRNKINALIRKATSYESMRSADITEDEQKEANMRTSEKLEEELGQVYKEGIEKNITNPCRYSSVQKQLL